ncbi:hypothetical protein FB563_0500 [Streptomyces puniciscabiei]|uniref:Uncharacterized protein n=1 Tax=Streptomyces puniciscabiei TaxID=164348 RepID=A0A542U924_9ACTN|nr:hypothetical protein FB563_0500 [Streptomyces puniciscabiei]
MLDPFQAGPRCQWHDRTLPLSWFTSRHGQGPLRTAYSDRRDEQERRDEHARVPWRGVM